MTCLFSMLTFGIDLQASLVVSLRLIRLPQLQRHLRQIELCIRVFRFMLDSVLVAHVRALEVTGASIEFAYLQIVIEARLLQLRTSLARLPTASQVCKRRSL